MKVILIGDKKSKRTEYFTKAAEQSGVFVSVVKLEDFLSYSHTIDNIAAIPNVQKFEKNNAILRRVKQEQKSQHIWVKIDPCTYESSNIEKMNEYLQNYQKLLSQLSENQTYHYLNHPAAILELLDKRKCKEKLIQQQIPVTPLLADKIDTIEQLHDLMKQMKCNSVFIKPVFGSGAAGIAAYRWNWNRNQGILYTSCKKINSIFLNTKKMHKITNKVEIEETLNMLFALDVIVEKWIPKAQYHGKSYDLRVVYQFGKINYIVARQSESPVTNLHLNNQALDYQYLNLSEEIMDEIEKICRQSIELFPKLSYAGIDILLDKKRQKPYIIEMNGQGDCIYQDMYGKNCIYQTQINMMQELLEMKWIGK